MPNPQARRRHNPYPWTWEIPVGISTLAVLILVVGMQLGRAIANLAAGADWQLPATEDLFTTVPALLHGDAAAGLPGFAGPVASPSSLAAWIVAVEALVIIVMVVSLRFGLDRWGPGRAKGMASRAEAERLLGLSRLRRNASLIRPDLYPRKGGGDDPGQI